MGDNLRYNQMLCPDVDTCEYICKDKELKEKINDLYCHHEKPHPATESCSGNKCCPNCHDVMVTAEPKKGKIIKVESMNGKTNTKS